MDQGSEDFAAFYERHRDPCFRAVLATVPDRHQAEELTAEAFARAWAGWRRLRGHPAPAAWVVRTALNTHVSWWRRRRREVAWDGAAGAEAGRPGSVGGAGGAGSTGADSADGDATAADLVLRAALRKLPLRQREVVVLRVFLDLDTKTTAAALGVAPGTVQAHLHRATKALRAELEASDEQEEVRK